MAYASVNATLGARGQRKTERAARRARKGKSNYRAHRKLTELQTSTGKRQQKQLRRRVKARKRKGLGPSPSVKKQSREITRTRKRAERRVRSVATQPRAKLPRREAFDASFRAVSPQTRSRYGEAAANKYLDFGRTPPKSVRKYVSASKVRGARALGQERRQEVKGGRKQANSDLGRAITVGTFVIPGGAALKGAQAVKGAAAARKAASASKTARTATSSTRATRAATAGTRRGPRSSPRAPSPAGKGARRYGQSSGIKGKATRRPTQGARPNRSTPKRAVKGRTRRKLERRHTRKPVKQRGRKAAQGAGAGASSLAAVDLAALAKGDDPEAIEKAARGAYEIGRLAVTEPGASARTLKDTIFGVPQALYEVGAAGYEAAPLTPGGTERAEKLGKTIAKDYKRRYGPLAEGDYEKFRKRGSKTGVTPFALDALIAVPPALRVAGAAARRGALGAKAKRVTTTKRPELRVAPGKTVSQRRSKGLVGAAAQEARDSARRRAGERRKAADPQENRRRLIEAENENEVVRLRRGRLTGGAARDQHTDVASRKGRAFVHLQNEQRDIQREFIPRVNKLSGNQKRSLKYALQFGIRDAKTARRIADRRIKQIEESRTDPVPAAMDEVRTLEAMARDADDIFTPEFNRLAGDLRRAEKRYATGDPVRGRRRRRDPALNTEQATLRRYRQQADLLGITRREGETNAQYVGRVRAEARKAGLDEAGYVTSEIPRGSRKYAEYALGGFRASHRPKRYTGRTFEQGVESTDPEVILRGLARNVKRRHNWRLVADTFDTYTPKWGRNKGIPELVKELNRRGIDENEVAFWNPAIYRRQAASALRREEPKAGAEIPDDLVADRVLGEAFAESTLSADAARDLAQAMRNGDVDPAEFTQTTGWSIVPKDAFNELESTTRPSGAVGRSADVAIQKASRYLLGANPPWLVAQVASNAALAGLAKAGPVSWVKAAAWYRKLPKDVRGDVDAFIGGGPFQNDVRLTRLGAAGDKTAPGFRQLLNGYRGLKETVGGAQIFGRVPGVKKTRAGSTQVRDFNPLDVMFRADNAQNNFFRRAVLYKDLNRRLYRDMGEKIGRAGAMETRLVNILRKDPQDQLAALARNPRILEEHAKAVRDYLGDYTTFTARERRVLKRSVMFYGYLRFSLRFTFATMPLKHPVMTGLMGNLARLQTDEIKELFGGEALPFALGRVYTHSGEKTVGQGSPKQTLVADFSGANPLSSALTEATGLRQAAGIFPPYVQMIASQVAEQNIFTGQPWQTEGISQSRIYTEEGFKNRLRIAANDSLSLLFPYRYWKETEAKGAKQGADSLAWDPRPIQYAEGEAKEKNQERKREYRKRPSVLREEFLPMYPQPAEPLIGVNQRIVKAREEELRNRYDEDDSSGSSRPTKDFSGLFGGSQGGGSVLKTKTRKKTDFSNLFGGG